MDKRELVARALDWTVAELLGTTGAAHDRGHGLVRPVQPVRSVEQLGQYIPGDHLVGARDFPIYAAAQGGNGHLIVHSDVMEYVKRPVVLEGVPDAYGILVTGGSMIPAFRPNDMALVHPRRPPERDSDVILFDHDHRTGDAKAMIKRLVGFNDRSWKLEQYNPPETFTEHRADWPICHQVVGKYNAR
ncbi:MAG: helix-turn-helix transcriptional regulator [Candidatus Afipia apatlaquensis]|uniref:Helix-turn-helix transcriptional regulator n=1 Tax=Candidatus Afipia apatlaquensis TaxID=2712852 RepID=A0A7C9VTX3_9BRAD|nr:helix-turn-helix transcriptional regulator [Candidatus Afipia apatlaquensis]